MEWLLNKENVRRFALGACEAHYKVEAYRPKRISKQFFEELNAHLRQHIVDLVVNRPKKGVTL